MKNFTFSKKWYEVLKSYPEEIRNQIYTAVLEYAFTGNVIEMQPIVRMAFDFIRYDMEERVRKRDLRNRNKPVAKLPESLPDNNAEQKDNTEKIVTQFYAQGKMPDPYSVRHNGRTREFSDKQIRQLITFAASDLTQSGLSPDDKTTFLSRLEDIVAFGANQICYLLDTHKPNNPLNDSLWSEIFDKTRKIYRSRFLK